MAKTISVISQQTAEVGSFGLVASGTTASIAAGVPTKGADAAAASPWTGAVSVMVDGDGSTSQRFTGIAKSNSTETASAAGTVELWEPFPGIIYNGYAKTSSTADTAAKILALKGKRVVFDLTTGDWTVDAAAADAKANSVVCLGTGNPTLATLNFVYAAHGTYLDFAISA
jgi:hypothetical protein